MNQLRIESPCPTLISRFDKSGNEYSCKSCNKKVIDFRNKTPEEIKSILKKDTCGIFLNSQLQQQVKMSKYTRFLFYCLTVLSFLGFNVSPLNAQSTSSIEKVSFNSTEKRIESAELNSDDEKDSKRNKRKLYRQERKKHKKRKEEESKRSHTIGCPSF